MENRKSLVLIDNKIKELDEKISYSTMRVNEFERFASDEKKSIERFTEQKEQLLSDGKLLEQTLKDNEADDEELSVTISFDAEKAYEDFEKHLKDNIGNYVKVEDKYDAVGNIIN